MRARARRRRPAGSRSIGMRCRIHTPAYYRPDGGRQCGGVSSAHGHLRRAGTPAAVSVARTGSARRSPRSGAAAWPPWRWSPWRAIWGVTKGSFYAHFATRDELLAATLARWEAEHDAGALAALAPGEDPAARLRGLVEAAVAFTEGVVGRRTSRSSGRSTIRASAPRWPGSTPRGRPT